MEGKKESLCTDGNSILGNCIAIMFVMESQLTKQ